MHELVAVMPLYCTLCCIIFPPSDTFPSHIYLIVDSLGVVLVKLLCDAV